MWNKTSGIKISRIKIGGYPRNLGGGGQSSVSAKRNHSRIKISRIKISGDLGTWWWETLKAKCKKVTAE